jgi:hypothetical protein
MYSAWGARLTEDFRLETCDTVATEFAAMFSAQPTRCSGMDWSQCCLRVRELRMQHVRSMNQALDTWSAEILASMQRIYQRMMSENIMKVAASAVSAMCRQVGREGLLEELGKTREMILNQLQHPDSGVRPDTLLLLLAQHLAPLPGRWAEAERALAKEAIRGPDSPAADVLVDEVLLQAGTVATLLTTVDMLALAPRGPEAAALEAVHGVAAALQQLRASFATIVMPEGLKSFLQEEASVVEVASPPWPHAAPGGPEGAGAGGQLRPEPGGGAAGDGAPHQERHAGGGQSAPRHRPAGGRPPAMLPAAGGPW